MDLKDKYGGSRPTKNRPETSIAAGVMSPHIPDTNGASAATTINYHVGFLLRNNYQLPCLFLAITTINACSVFLLY